MDTTRRRVLQLLGLSAAAAAMEKWTGAAVWMTASAPGPSRRKSSMAETASNVFWPAR